MKKFYLVPMLLLLGAIGCEQNPTIPKGSNTPPVIPIEVPKTWLIQGEETVFVEEGGAGTGVYVGFVEEPGLPILSAENLPAWMTFDGTTGELVWNPDHAAANDPANPQATSKVYEIGLVLESSVLPQAVVEKKIKVVVLNVPQESQLVANNQTIIPEGTSGQVYLTVQSLDFPAGPFQIVTTDLPEGAVVNHVANNTFLLTYSPDKDTVLASDSFDFGCNCYYKDFAIAAYGIDQLGNQSTVKNFSLRIQDTRLAPVITAPSTIDVGGDTSFMIIAEDLNGDASPSLRLVTEPTVGIVTVTSLGAAPGRSILQVSWKSVPAGTGAGAFVFESCVENVCVTKQVDARVTF